MYVPRNPFFSEFTYAYALTEELVAAEGSSVRILPIFPSLIVEGKYGFDVMINQRGIPLFLQFKLAHQMTRRAKEVKGGYFTTKFYRMYLRCSGPTNQHSLLLDLEAEGNSVYYVAPKFHFRRELITAYENREIWNQSLQIKPSEIGPQSDEDHHIGFLRNGNWRSFSDEPHGEGRISEPKAVMESIRKKLDVKNLPPWRSSVEHVDDGMMKVLVKREREFSTRERVEPRHMLADLPVLHRVSYVARHFFDCQFCVATLK